MSLDRRRLIALAASTGFRQETLEKVDRLIGLLDDICRHPLLRNVLVLKGGTALNLGFGVPFRLSVDLDFNYIGAAGRDAMLAQRLDVERTLEQIANAQGYRVQHSAEEHAGHKYFLGYTSVSGSDDRVEVDLNFLHRIPIVPPIALHLWRPDGHPGEAVPVVGIEELCAGKMCALLARVVPRDCYDVIRLPAIAAERWDQRLRRLFIALAGTLDRPLHEYGEQRLDKLTEADVTAELHPMLSVRDLPTAARLKRDTWIVLSPLLALTAEEREYSERLQLGELRPELLFPDDERQAAILRQHPALLWKVRNARKPRSPRGARTASSARSRRS